MTDELIEALQPFALYAEQMEKSWGPRDDSVYYGVKRPGADQITYGDFRRAARVLRELTKKENDNADQETGS